jgi:hypothetical protein
LGAGIPSFKYARNSYVARFLWYVGITSLPSEIAVVEPSRFSLKGTLYQGLFQITLRPLLIFVILTHNGGRKSKIHKAQVRAKEVIFVLPEP